MCDYPCVADIRRLTAENKRLAVEAAAANAKATKLEEQLVMWERQLQAANNALYAAIARN